MTRIISTTMNTSRASNKSVYLILFVCLATGLALWDLHDFQTPNVAATAAVTITPSDADGDQDEDNAETELSGPQEEQHREAIQPAANSEKQKPDDEDHEGEYQIAIPDGAAWEETISDRFYPPEVIVPSGSDVTWTNEDDLTHTITSGKKAGYGMYEFVQDGAFNSGNLDEGDSFTFHFTEPGRYEYFCVPHPWMNGAVVVQ
jgi:plastocyanin